MVICDSGLMLLIVNGLICDGDPRFLIDNGLMCDSDPLGFLLIIG